MPRKASDILGNNYSIPDEVNLLPNAYLVPRRASDILGNNYLFIR